MLSAVSGLSEKNGRMRGMQLPLIITSQPKPQFSAQLVSQKTFLLFFLLPRHHPLAPLSPASNGIVTDPASSERVKKIQNRSARKLCKVWQLHPRQKLLLERFKIEICGHDTLIQVAWSFMLCSLGYRLRKEKGDSDVVVKGQESLRPWRTTAHNRVYHQSCPLVTPKVGTPANGSSLSGLNSHANAIR
ncbi:uncharacterized protein MYCFIDRAFT_209210 [Pseudocercospora fijiensis CIRAD86]|uniref:Uncharacterized protein n=1 Tax=Pseudocercospora fijiensis (strain CIRAD86) TaxID=383855 RepID=M3AL59_PSEFD|nr:uncharacterized protein MYCFIDRAFT_209210 [Pseudocercospora fijiensis CIRAD86]EME77888.1 hypothetical protein MYCFIDRAFT_209210 [Pseudocercospora fijiensis CIRAD86]